MVIGQSVISCVAHVVNMDIFPKSKHGLIEFGRTGFLKITFKMFTFKKEVQQHPTEPKEKVSLCIP